MDNAVKQRLIGALILLALAVLFWPIIFVKDVDDRNGLSVMVPKAPPVDLSPLPEPDDAGFRQGRESQAQILEDPDVLVMSGAAVPELGSSAPASRDEVLPVRELEEARDQVQSPTMDEDGLPIAFSLQVATMANRASADVLRDELLAAGYKSYVKRLRRDDRMLYRVLVGPRFSRDELTTVKTAIDKSWRVESMIIRYIP